MMREQHEAMLEIMRANAQVASATADFIRVVAGRIEAPAAPPSGGKGDAGAAFTLAEINANAAGDIDQFG